MVSGEVSSSPQTNGEQHPYEWWGPDLTLPTAGDQEWTSGQARIEVTPGIFHSSVSVTTLTCAPADMPMALYEIIEREIEKEFMNDSKLKYYITVRWDL